jgi:hypothetical protein
MRRLLTIIAFSLVPINVWASPIERQEPTATFPRTAIEFFDVPDIPVIIGRPSLSKASDRYVVEFSITNRAEEEVRGVGFLLLITDPSGAPRRQMSFWIIADRLKGYAMKDYQYKFPTKVNLSLGDGDRILMVAEQVIGESSIWNVLKPEEALRSYAAGENYAPPRVVRVSNNVDSRPGGL